MRRCVAEESVASSVGEGRRAVVVVMLIEVAEVVAPLVEEGKFDENLGLPKNIRDYGSTSDVKRTTLRVARASNEWRVRWLTRRCQKHIEDAKVNRKRNCSAAKGSCGLVGFDGLDGFLDGHDGVTPDLHVMT